MRTTASVTASIGDGKSARKGLGASRTNGADLSGGNLVDGVAIIRESSGGDEVGSIRSTVAGNAGRSREIVEEGGSGIIENEPLASGDGVTTGIRNSKGTDDNSVTQVVVIIVKDTNIFDSAAAINGSGCSLDGRVSRGRAVEGAVGGEVHKHGVGVISDGDDLVEGGRVTTAISCIPNTSDNGSTGLSVVEISKRDGDGAGARAARVSRNSRAVGVGEDLRVDVAANGKVAGTEDESRGGGVGHVDPLGVGEKARALIDKAEGTGNQTVASGTSGDIRGGLGEISAVVGSLSRGELSGNSGVVCTALDSDVVWSARELRCLKISPEESLNTEDSVTADISHAPSTEGSAVARRTKGDAIFESGIYDVVANIIEGGEATVEERVRVSATRDGEVGRECVDNRSDGISNGDVLGG